VLDGVAVVGARLLQGLLEMVIVALSLAHSIDRCDRVGVGVTWVPLLLFSCVVEGLWRGPHPALPAWPFPWFGHR
jgi:hypothetical protein